MAARFLLKPCVVCCALASIASSASAETLIYNPDTTHNALSAAPGDLPSLNPYQQRRNLAVAEKAEVLTPPLPIIASISVPSETPNTAPLKVTIPNAKLATQEAAPKAIIMASADTPGPAIIAAAPAPSAYAAQAETTFPWRKSAPLHYESPSAIIDKKTLHMEKLQPEMADAAAAPNPFKIADLAPAAGGDTPAITPLIDTPAIAVPPNNAPAPVTAAPTAPTIPVPPLPAVTAPLPVAQPAMPAPSAPSAPVIPAPVPPTAPAPAPTPLIPAVMPPTAPQQEHAVPTQNPQAVEQALQPLLTPEPPAQPPTMSTPPEPEKPAAPHPKKKPAPHKDPAADNSEPEGDLSPTTKQMLNHIPSKLDQKKREVPKPVSIDHAKNVESEFKPDEGTETVKHEAMGIKIEIKKPKFNSDYELDKAYDALSTGHSEEAIEIYKNVLENDPHNTGALFGLATLYHRAGQIELARPLYAKLLAINPAHRDGLNNFLVLLGDESPQAALPQLEKLEAKNPDFSPIPAQMAVIYEKQGDSDHAVEKIIRAIKLAPENLTYRYNLAIMLDKQGKYDEAGKLYYQLLEAWRRGESIPGDPQKIQQRLTFISSNRQ